MTLREVLTGISALDNTELNSVIAAVRVQRTAIARSKAIMFRPGDRVKWIHNHIPDAGKVLEVKKTWLVVQADKRVVPLRIHASMLEKEG